MRVIPVVFLFLFLLCVPVHAALSPQQVADFAAQLGGNDERVYRGAAQALALDKQVDVLLNALESDNTARRVAVITAIPYCMSPLMAGVLIDLVKLDKNAQVRAYAIDTLSFVYDSPELAKEQPLILATCWNLANEADTDLARTAVYALARMMPQSLDYMIDVLVDGRTATARLHAASLIFPAKDTRVVVALAKAVADKDIGVSEAAISSLGKHGDKRVAPFLLQVMQDATLDQRQLVATSQALAALGAPEVLDKLLELAKNSKLPLNIYALGALGGYADPRAGQVIVSALSHPTMQMRYTAANIVTTNKYAPAADALLVQAAREVDLSTRRQLLQALAVLAEPRARNLFAAALADNALRIAGFQGLLALNDDETRAMIQGMLEKQNPSEYSSVVQMLGDSGSPYAIEPLLQHSQRWREQHPDKDWAFEGRAARALTGMTLDFTFMNNNLKGRLKGSTDYAAPVAVGILHSGNAGVPKAGEVVDALVTLYNRSQQALVVLELHPTSHYGEDPVILSGPVYGQVTAGDGGYIYNSQPQQASTITLHAGLLLPGQAMQVKITYRPVNYIERFMVRFLAASQPYDGTAASLAPLTVFIPDPAQAGPEKRVFVPFTDAGWRAVCKPMTVAAPTGPGVADRAVVLAVDPAVRPQEAAMTVYPQFTDDQFYHLQPARALAARLTGKNQEQLELGYSKTLRGFVVADGDEHWMLTNENQQAKGKALPTFPLLLLKDADMGKVRVQIDPQQPDTLPAGAKFWDTYPIEKGDGMYTTGRFIAIDAAALPAFLDAVLAHKGMLELHEYFFRSRYYVLKLQ